MRDLVAQVVLVIAFAGIAGCLSAMAVWSWQAIVRSWRYRRVRREFLETWQGERWE